MALATEDDVTAALGGKSPSTDVTTLLEEASDLVLGYLRLTSLDPVPPAVSRVTASMVAAAVNRPAGLASMAPGDSLTAGPYSVNGGDAAGVWLTNALKLRLLPYRAHSNASVSLQSELYGEGS